MSAMQPWVGLPQSSCRKIAEPRPGDDWIDVVADRDEVLVGARRGPEPAADLDEGRRRTTGDVPEGVVAGRRRVLVPEVAADEPVVGVVDAGIGRDPVDHRTEPGGATRRGAR